MVGRFLLNLLFPPACRGCGERFDLFVTPDPPALCPTCLAAWSEAVREREQNKARPALLDERVCAFYARVAYHPDEKQTAERLLLRLKDHCDRPLLRFFAQDMRLPIWQLLEQHGDPQNTCVVFIPRRPEAKRLAGLDQAEQLAQAIGRALELPIVAALRHRRRTAAQKSLDAQSRVENARAAYTLTKGAAALQGKTVLLVDDIATAGATLAAAAQLLLDAGAKQIICCTVGMTAHAK